MKSPFYSLKVYRHVLRIAWPLIVSNGAFTAMLFCDRMFLAWHSTTSIQAALPAGIWAFTLTSGFMAVAAYTNTFVAQFYGAGDYNSCSKATAQGVAFSLFSIPALLILIIPGRWIIQACGHAPDVTAEELSYFTIIVAGSIPIPLNAALSSFFSGRGKTQLIMVVTILCNAVNVVLDYLLIFGKAGLPALGIQGAAYATVIAGIISPVILLAIYFSRYTPPEFQVRKNLHYDHILFMRMLRFSIPSGLHLALDVGSFSIFVLLTGRMGELASSTSAIALSINTLAFLPLVGIGIATSILVGQYQGAGDTNKSRIYTHAAFQIGVFYMSIAAYFFIFQPEMLVSLFTDRGANTLKLSEILPASKIILIFAALWGYADAANLIYGSALKGAGDTRFVMVFSLILAWGLLVPGAFILIVWLNMSIISAWAWVCGYVILLGVGFILRFRRGKWQFIDILGSQPRI